VLTRADGTTLSLAALRGKPVYVFLFASWCEPCAIALPWIRAAYAADGDRVQFVGIDVLDSHAAAVAYVRAQHLPFDVAIVDKATIDAVADDDARLAGGAKYELPADYLIDAAGIVRAAWHGVPVDRGGTPLDVLPGALATAGFVPSDTKVAP
jgi:thiol-disulfide isomerase/thioredoxin